MARSTVVLDACLAITFGNAESLDTVTGLRAHRVVIARRALGEILRPPARDEVQRAVEAGLLGVEQVETGVVAELEALVRFDNASRFHGRGESEVLALAASRGWIVGSDEVAVGRFAVQAFGSGRMAGTLDILRWAVQERRMTVGEAVALLRRLDVGPALERRIAAGGMTPEDLLRGT